MTVVSVAAWPRSRRQPGVEGPIDVAHRVSERGREGRVVARVARVVEVPALMADAVAVAERGHEEIPRLTGEQVLRDRRLPRDAGQQVIAKRALGVRPVHHPVAATERRGAMARVHLRDQLGGPRAGRHVGVVGAPVDDLEAVHVRTERRLRDVEEAEAPTGATERVPERLAL